MPPDLERPGMKLELVNPNIPCCFGAELPKNGSTRDLFALMMTLEAPCLSSSKFMQSFRSMKVYELSVYAASL